MAVELVYGYISEYDPAKGLVRVEVEEDDDVVDDPSTLVTPFIPFAVKKSQNDKETFPYDIREHVAVLMDWENETGVVIGSVYNETDLPDGAGVDIHRILFKDGSYIQFDRSSGDFVINVKGKLTATVGGDVEVTSDGTAKVTANSIELHGDVTIDGNVTVQGDMSTMGDIDLTGTLTADTEVKAGLIPLSSHKHGGVQPGSSLTLTPVP